MLSIKYSTVVRVSEISQENSKHYFLEYQPLHGKILFCTFDLF